MLLPFAAVLLLSALQLALGKPATSCQIDATKNKIVAQRLTATEIVIDYVALNPPCGPYKVVVWPATGYNPYTADVKAGLYVEPANSTDTQSVTINLDELDVGEYKAAFICEEGECKRQPWLVSKTFKVDGKPPTKKHEHEACNKADDCSDGLYCAHQCGGAIDEQEGRALCLINGEPTCRKESERPPKIKTWSEEEILSMVQPLK